MPKKAAFRFSRWLAVCGFLSFLICLVLPAVQFTMLSEPSILLGAEAALWSFLSASGAIMELFTKPHKFESVDLVFFVLGVASLLNIAFLITPVLHIFRLPRKKHTLVA